jgi:hypothetical protein
MQYPLKMTNKISVLAGQYAYQEAGPVTIFCCSWRTAGTDGPIINA